jgi:hypothetical protein
MVHIGGYPGHYTPEIRTEISLSAPKLFISGHSHILKVIYDNKYQLLLDIPVMLTPSSGHIDPPTGMMV